MSPHTERRVINQVLGLLKTSPRPTSGLCHRIVKGIHCSRLNSCGLAAQDLNLSFSTFQQVLLHLCTLNRNGDQKDSLSVLSRITCRSIRAYFGQKWTGRKG